MKTRLLVFCPAVVSFLLASLPVLAHHGATAYDLQRSITLIATVTGLEWMNPHCLLHFDAKNEKGEVLHWSIEIYNPLWMTRAGWTRNTLKAGDPITVTFHAAKNGGWKIEQDGDRV